MKIHEEKTSNKSKALCGYCREEGHNQYQCPHVRGDWENFLSRLEIPKDERGQPIKRGYNYASWRNGDDFDPLVNDIVNNSLTSWFRNCRKAYVVQKERGFNLETKTKRKAVNRTCGFCGDKDHTRRKCPTMEQFLKDCYKANENWRQACYKELVETHGVSVGACVKVSYTEGWNSPEIEAVGIIKSINWDTINVFSACSIHSDFAFSPLEIEVLVNGKTCKIKNVHEHFRTINENGKIRYYWGDGCNLLSVITHSPTPLPPEWITSYKESFETLVKKRTLDQLKNGMKSSWRSPNLVAHINAWK